MKPASAALLLSLMLPATILLAATPAQCQVRAGAPAPPPTKPAPDPAPGSAADHNAQAARLLAQGKPDAALAEYDAAIKVHPDSLDTLRAFVARGDLYLSRQQWDKALDSYEWAGFFAPTLLPQQSISDYFKLDKGAQVARDASERSVTFLKSRAGIGKGRVLLLTNHPQEAVDALHTVMLEVRIERDKEGGIFNANRQRDGEDFHALEGYAVRGAALVELHRWQEALVDLNEALKNEMRLNGGQPSRNAETYFNRGRALNGSSQKDKALSDFNVAVKLDPAYNAPLKTTSYAKKLTPRDPDKARDAPVDLSETAPAYVLNAEEGNATLTDFTYNQAIKLDPKYAPAYAGRARVYAAWGSGKPARVKKDNDDPIGNIFADAKPLTDEQRAGYNAKALADFKQAIALEPHEPRWLEALIAFEKATPAYAGNVAADETKLVALNKDLAALTTLMMFGDGPDPETILPLWKVKP